ncbi:MAG: pYEATS domain-containing protein [Pseudomarimonas sp.]
METDSNVSLRIAQDSHYDGDDWWTWSIWIAGSAEALDGIERVEYQLHPTFPNPQRTVCHRPSQFKLNASGWGVFTIHAQVIARDGRVSKLSHRLQLEYDDRPARFA